MKQALAIVLFLVPFIAQLVIIPWVNTIQPTVLGFPFFHVWLFVWMLLTPLFTYGMHTVLQSGRKEK